MSVRRILQKTILFIDRVEGYAQTFTNGFVRTTNALTSLAENVSIIARVEQSTRYIPCPGGCKQPAVKCDHGCYVANSGTRVFVYFDDPCSICNRTVLDYYRERKEKP